MGLRWGPDAAEAAGPEAILGETLMCRQTQKTIKCLGLWKDEKVPYYETKSE